MLMGFYYSIDRMIIDMMILQVELSICKTNGERVSTLLRIARVLTTEAVGALCMVPYGAQLSWLRLEDIAAHVPTASWTLREIRRRRHKLMSVSFWQDIAPFNCTGRSPLMASFSRAASIMPQSRRMSGDSHLQPAKACFL